MAIVKTKLTNKQKNFAIHATELCIGLTCTYAYM